MQQMGPHAHQDPHHQEVTLQQDFGVGQPPAAGFPAGPPGAGGPPMYPYPGISPYDNKFSQTFNDRGIWKYDTQNGPRKYFFTLEGFATTETAGMQPTAPEALDRLYRPQALEVPVLTARDGPIAALDPSAAGGLLEVGEDKRERVVAEPTVPTRAVAVESERSEGPGVAQVKEIRRSGEKSAKRKNSPAASADCSILDCGPKSNSGRCRGCFCHPPDASVGRFSCSWPIPCERPLLLRPILNHRPKLSGSASTLDPR